MYQITISGNTLDELKQNVTSIAHNLGAVPAKVDTSAPAEKSKKKAAPAPKEADPEPEAEEEAEPVTKVHVQQAMKAVLEAGHKDEMATLMRDTFNANKLSELSQDDYPAFVDALKEMA